MNLYFLAILHMALSLNIILCALCLPDLTITLISDILRASPTIRSPFITDPDSVYILLIIIPPLNVLHTLILLVFGILIHGLILGVQILHNHKLHYTFCNILKLPF